MARSRERTGRRSTARALVLLVAGPALGAALLAGCAVGSASVDACDGASVRITVGQFGVGHGHFGGALLFQNRGAAACTLRGFPIARAVPSVGDRTVAVLDSDRGYVGGLLPGRTRAPVVMLSPGGVASAILEGTGPTAGAASCPTYRALLVGVPGGRATTALAIETATCRHLKIHPVVPGSSGDQSP